MAITFQQLQDLVTKENLKIFVAPDRPMVRFGIRGNFGTYDVVIHLQDEGRFLQFRTVSYAACPKEHPHLGAVLRLLLQMDYETRLVKFGWDASDGEIVAYVDMWLMDNTLTQEQLGRMLQNYLPAIDMAFQRLKTTIETGTDPGYANVPGKATAPPGAPTAPGPPEIREI